MGFPEFLKEKGVKIQSERIDNTNEDFRDADAWKVKLKYKGASLTTNFYMGYGHQGKEPQAADVLHSLLIDTQAVKEDFETFCGNFGYDTDSRKAEKLYKECRKIGKKFERFLGNDFDAFVEAATDY